MNADSGMFQALAEFKSNAIGAAIVKAIARGAIRQIVGSRANAPRVFKATEVAARRMNCCSTARGMIDELRNEGQEKQGGLGI